MPKVFYEKIYLRDSIKKVVCIIISIIGLYIMFY